MLTHLPQLPAHWLRPLAFASRVTLYIFLDLILGVKAEEIGCKSVLVGTPKVGQGRYRCQSRRVEISCDLTEMEGFISWGSLLHKEHAVMYLRVR